MTADQSASGSFVDAESFFSGAFRSSQDLLIAGELEGEIVCDGRLTIAEGARVSATCTSGSVSVAGRLEGQVSCSGCFEILPQGRVSARVNAGSLIVHDGAKYDGDLRLHEEPPGLAPREPQAGAQFVARNGPASLQSDAANISEPAIPASGLEH